MNLVALAGRLSRPAAERLLPSGDRLVSLDLSVTRDDGPAESIPVVWFDPPGSATDLDVDAHVVVVGRVRRRFFRANGRTESRTEVVADTIVPAGSTRRVRTALGKAARSLEPDG